MGNVIVKPMLALRHTAKKKQSIANRIMVSTIKLRTKSIYYHSEVILDSKWITANGTDGVLIRDLKELNHDDWDYIELPERELTAEQHEDLWAYINSQDDKDYDFTGVLFSQFFKFGRDNLDKWFCSEITAKIIQLIGYPKFMEITPADMSPGDLDVRCRKM